MKYLGPRIVLSVITLIFPALMLLFLPLFAITSLEFSDVKKFDTVDEAMVWQKNIISIANKYDIDVINTEISIHSPPTASYLIRLKPLGSGYLPERREFNGKYTSDSKFYGYFAGIFFDGGFALLCMGFLLRCIWSKPNESI